MVIRRDLLQGMAGLALAGLAGRAAAGDAGLPDGAAEAAILAALPGKRPLVRKSFRPPNFETPVRYFDTLYTPNDAFFVRYHLSAIPRLTAGEWRLRIGGDAAGAPREFTLRDLRTQFEQVEITAVNQCSGNRRGLYTPHVPGIQWASGAMGNARWRGVRLRDLLARAGVGRGAVEVVFDGADHGVMTATPDFIKSLPVDKALDASVLVALDMNGEPLPHWHGFPARLVVPGWTATYWVKHLTTINVATTPFDGFWMKTAYRIPRGAFPGSAPFASQDTEANTPITSMVVNSLVTSPADGARVRLGATVDVRGIAWDGGHGIRVVECSADAGRTWRPVELGDGDGRFSWRLWRFGFRPGRAGSCRLLFRATNHAGETQGTQLVANPAGYHHNLVQSLDLVVS